MCCVLAARRFSPKRKITQKTTKNCVIIIHDDLSVLVNSEISTIYLTIFFLLFACLLAHFFLLSFHIFFMYLYIVVICSRFVQKFSLLYSSLIFFYLTFGALFFVFIQFGCSLFCLYLFFDFCVLRLFSSPCSLFFLFDCVIRFSIFFFVNFYFVMSLSLCPFLAATAVFSLLVCHRLFYFDFFFHYECVFVILRMFQATV